MTRPEYLSFKSVNSDKAVKYLRPEKKSSSYSTNSLSRHGNILLQNSVHSLTFKTGKLSTLTQVRLGHIQTTSIFHLHINEFAKYFCADPCQNHQNDTELNNLYYAQHCTNYQTKLSEDFWRTARIKPHLENTEEYTAAKKAAATRKRGTQRICKITW